MRPSATEARNLWGHAVHRGAHGLAAGSHRRGAARLDIFAGRGHVVTVRHGSTTAYKEVRTRCEGAPKMLAMGEGFVVYSIMDFVVDNYFPILQELESEVDALEDTIFSRNFPPTEYRTDLLNPARIAASSARGSAAAGDVQPHDAVRRAADRSGHASLFPRHSRPCDPPGREHHNLRDLLAAGLEAHLLLSSVEQNKIIKIFSVAAVVLMPPTLIASIYGMNFKSMPELEWPHGYFIALVLMVIVAVLPYLFFRWKKWL